MAKRKSKKKVNIIIYSLVIALIAAFALLSSLSDNGYLPFDFPRWSDFGTIFGKQDVIDKSPLSVHFIDVGNADCTLVKSPRGNILIDAGEQDDEATIIQYLRKFKVKRLDYVIATHPHADHIGSMPKVLKSFEIGEFIMPRMTEKIMPTTQVYKDLLQTIKDRNIKAEYAEPGRIIKLGDVSLKLFSPLREYENINDMSIVTKLTYKSFSAMFMGDAESDVENDLLSKYNKSEFKAQVLKVAHHGSSSSSTKRFIDAVGAEYYYVPCGVGNKYGHPSAETMDTLKAKNGSIFRADYNGNVVVLSDGERVNVINES